MKKWFGLFVFLTVVAALYIVLNSQKKPTVLSEKTVTHSSHYFDPEFFTQASEKGKEYKQTPKGKVIGGIIPHHLLVGPIIAAFFDEIKSDDIKTVILIGPNHYNIGKPNISTSEATWTTVFGNLEPDSKKITLITNDSPIIIDEQVFETEHSIYGLVSFVKKSFPHAKIVPVVIQSVTKKNEVDELANTLSKIIDDNTIVLASVDFSHYLPSQEADTYDEESIAALTNFDLEKILNLSNTKNFDSPQSLYVLSKLMKEKNTHPKLLQNTNSAKFTHQPTLPFTTSYVTMYYTQ